MPIITLLTDFGVDDAYVGIMKGVILSINPSVTIVDITHEIEPQDVVRAACTIQSAYRYFPDGTVHVVVVDPGVGSARPILAAKISGHFFLAPDNGVLSLVWEKNGEKAVVRVENPSYFLKKISSTFHGRDIFSPVAAHLTKGVELGSFGPEVNQEELAHLTVQRPYVSEKGELIGCILWIDHFGNLITNVDLNRIQLLCRSPYHEKLEIRVGKKKIIGLSRNYQSAKPKTPLALIGSHGYLEIAVNCGNAKQYLGAKKGDPIRVIG